MCFLVCYQRLSSGGSDTAEPVEFMDVYKVKLLNISCRQNICKLKLLFWVDIFVTFNYESTNKYVSCFYL